MFEITFYDTDGQKKTVEVVGDLNKIREKFFREGKVIVSVKKKGIRTFFRKPKEEEIAIVLNSVADLLDSGVGLTRAVETVAYSLGSSSKMKPVLLHIVEGLKEGRNFTSLLEDYRTILGDTVLQMIKAGYETGRLSESLRLTSDYLTHLTELKKEMIKKMSYPLSVFVIGVIALFINTKFAIPRIVNSDLFRTVLKEGQSFFLTLLVLLSKVVPLLFVLVALVTAGIFLFYMKNPEKAERIFFRIPYLREFVFYKSFFIAFMSVARLLASGVKLGTAFEIVAKTIRLHTVKKDFVQALERLKRGESFVSGFTSLSIIEKTILETATNEKRLEQGFEKIANIFYRNYVEKIRAITPKIYATVLGFTVFVFLLMVFAIGIPYAKLLSSLGG